MGPLGRKVVTPNPPLSASHGAQRGVMGHNFSTQWSHCFGFGPSRSLSQGSLSEFTPLSEFSPLSYRYQRMDHVWAHVPDPTESTNGSLTRQYWTKPITLDLGWSSWG